MKPNLPPNNLKIPSISLSKDLHSLSSEDITQVPFLETKFKKTYSFSEEFKTIE